MIIRDISARIKSENAIKEAESFIRSAFDGISSHIAIVDEKGEILAVNNAWREFAEANPPLLVNVNEGANYIEVCENASGEDSSSAQEFVKSLKLVLAGKLNFYEMEYSCHSPQESRWFIARISKFPGDGNPKAIIAHENITTRKLAELELSKNRSFIMSVIENLPIGLAVNSVDPTVAFEYMNSNFAKFYGTTFEELSSPDSFWEVVYEDPAFREELKNRVLSDIATGKPEKMVWRDIPITRNGKLVNYITARNIPLYEKNLMISTVWDVTDRKLDEEQITRLNNNLQILISALNELTTAQSLDDIVETVTNSARKLIGSDGCTFVLKDNDNCFYIDENSISPLWKGRKFPLTSCVSGWVMLNKQVAIIPDIYADDRVPIDAYRSTFVKSMVMVPINASKVYGAIGNYWSNNYTPTESEIKLIETLADATARVYENIRLYGDMELKISEKTKELNERIEELERFHDATIDREIRMKELRDELDRLKKKSK
jgi:PAS domain-containing protein